MASRIARACARSRLAGGRRRVVWAACAAALLGAALALPAAAGYRTASPARHSHGYSMGFHVSGSGPADLQYAIMESGNNTTCSVSDDDAWRVIETLQKEVESTGHVVMWFALDGKDYAVRDEAVIERARDIVRPMNELGRQQGQLGKEQGELGRRQGELGRIQGRIGELQGRFARLQATSSSDSRGEIESLRMQLEELRADARDLGERQRDLGAQQRVLGERQRELGERQRIASKEAMIRLRSLAEDAVKSRKAEPIGD